MSESPFVLEGNQILREGETRVFSVVWDDFATISRAGVEAFVNGSTQSTGTDGVLSSAGGSSVFSGNVQTLPALTVPAGSGGVAIVLEPAMVSGSQTYKTGIVCIILKPGEE